MFTNNPVTVSEDRVNRYYDKLNHCKSSLNYLNEWITNEKYYININPMRKYAIYKVLTELVEAISDVIAMILKDLKHGPKEDYLNFEKATELDIINKKQTKILTKSKGVRNRVVHNYNGLNDDTALLSIFDLLDPLGEICEVLQVWIENNFLN